MQIAKAIRETSFGWEALCRACELSSLFRNHSMIASTPVHNSFLQSASWRAQCRKAYWNIFVCCCVEVGRRLDSLFPHSQRNRKTVSEGKKSLIISANKNLFNSNSILNIENFSLSSVPLDTAQCIHVAEALRESSRKYDSATSGLAANYDTAKVFRLHFLDEAQNIFRNFECKHFDDVQMEWTFAHGGNNLLASARKVWISKKVSALIFE